MALTESTPKELEHRARTLESQDPDAAKTIYGLAAERWHSTNDTSYSASRYLQCSRKAGVDRAGLVGEARQLAAKFPGDDWIAGTYAWICYDLAVEAAERGDDEKCVEALREVVALIGKLKNPSLLAERLIGLLSRLSRPRDARGTERADLLRAVKKVLMTIILSPVSIAVMLPDHAEGNRPPPLKVFYYLMRRVFAGLGEYDLLQQSMNEAVQRFPDDEWFHESRISATAALGHLDEANTHAKEAMDRLPESWAVASAVAEVSDMAGRPEEAVDVLATVCQGTRLPWSWARLADMLERNGQTDRAVEALGVGLSFLRKEDRGKGWKLYHRRAMLLADMGDIEGAAVELWLGMEARMSSGWSVHRDQERLATEGKEAMAVILQRLDREPGETLRQARHRYGAIRREWMERAAVNATVTRLGRDRLFGFARDEKGGRDIYLPGKLLDKTPLDEGDCVRIVVVPTLDRKKGRKGWRAARIVGAPREGQGRGS